MIKDEELPPMVPKLSSLQDDESEGEEDEWVKEIRTSHER